MADKVEYGKIVVQVDQIMQKLHQVAKENAKVEEGGFSLFNSLVDTDSPAEGMNPTIILRKAEPIDVKEKGNFFKKIRDYVKYFAGDNYAEKITEDSLVPIFTNDNLNEGQESSITSESRNSKIIFVNHAEKLVFEAVETLFGDQIVNEETTPGGDTSSEGSESSSEEPSEPEEAKKEDKVYGFSVAFLFYKGGQSVNGVGFGSKGKRFLSGMWADLANIKIKTLGGGEIPVGGILAKATRLFTRTKININDADNFIKNILKNDYPQSSAIVRGYDTKSLRSYLMNSDQWNPDYEKMFSGCEYAITIEVEKKDKSYDQYTKESIANICTRAFGDALKIAKNPFTANKVKPDQVIKIENYRSEFKNQSIYNRRQSGKDGASATNENAIPYERYVKNTRIDPILQILFEETDISSTVSSNVSSDVSSDVEISVDFRIKNPKKENALSQSQGVVAAKMKGFDEKNIPKPEEYEGFRFKFWNPDPNEFTSNQSRQENGKTVYYPNTSEAVYVKVNNDKDNYGEGNDFYIIPHKCLVSKNRKDEYEVANDGTVTAKRSKQDYKTSDFQR